MFAATCCATAVHPHTSDSLIPAFVSLVKWTPYFWAQQRFGMLIPALTLPIDWPFANYAAQLCLEALAGYVALIAGARYLIFGPNPARWVGTMAALAMMLLSPKLAFDWMIQPYALSMALGFAGLCLAEGSATAHPERLLGGAMLVALAGWVNAGICLVLGVAWVARRLNWAGDLSRTRAEAQASFALVVLSGGWLLAAPDPGSVRLGWQPIAQLVQHTFTEAGWAFVLAAIIGFLAIIWSKATYATPSATLCIAAGMALLLPPSQNAWVQDNLLAGRYALPSMALIAIGIAAMVPAPTTLRIPPELNLAIAALVLWGAPNWSGFRRQLERVEGLQADLAGCEAISGDYWQVWPVVFAANERRFERGETTPIVAITTRAEPMLPLLPEHPKVCTLTP